MMSRWRRSRFSSSSARFRSSISLSLRSSACTESASFSSKASWRACRLAASASFWSDAISWRRFCTCASICSLPCSALASFSWYCARLAFCAASSSSSFLLIAFDPLVFRVSSFFTTVAETALARWAKRSVMMASSTLAFSPRSITTNAALQFPASDDCSSRVSFESRNGTRIAPFDASAFTTEERASRLMLMRLASSWRALTPEAEFWSTAADFLDDSIPARSTSVSRPCGFPSAVCASIEMMPCPRLERGFIAMAATTRRLSPSATAAMTSAVFATGFRVSPSGSMCPGAVSRSGRYLAFEYVSCSRSLTLSL
mmetsp:Transcript_48105/g.125804  ORF Transcript_48105/g.125804 Transcript_48105/m.125804 type:complete len:315 (-) Transcript_48105:24-968(-)